MVVFLHYIVIITQSYNQFLFPLLNIMTLLNYFDSKCAFFMFHSRVCTSPKHSYYQSQVNIIRNNLNKELHIPFKDKPNSRPALR